MDSRSVKLLLPPLQSRGISQQISVLTGDGEIVRLPAKDRAAQAMRSTSPLGVSRISYLRWAPPACRITGDTYLLSKLSKYLPDAAEKSGDL